MPLNLLVKHTIFYHVGRFSFVHFFKQNWFCFLRTFLLLYWQLSQLCKLPSVCYVYCNTICMFLKKKFWNSISSIGTPTSFCVCQMIQNKINKLCRIHIKTWAYAEMEEGFKTILSKKNKGNFHDFKTVLSLIFHHKIKDEIFEVSIFFFDLNPRFSNISHFRLVIHP